MVQWLGLRTSNAGGMGSIPGRGTKIPHAAWRGKKKKKERKKLNGRKPWYLTKERDFPGGTVVKNPPADAGDTGLIPGPGRSHMPRSN